MKKLSMFILLAAFCLGACGEAAEPPVDEGGGGNAPNQPPANAPDTSDEALTEALAKGRAFLLSQQGETGAIGELGPAESSTSITALSVPALVGSMPQEEVAENEAIQKALAHIASFQQENGSIDDGSPVQNYITSAAISAFTAARASSYRRALAEATAYLQRSQIAQDEADLSYGGFPYKQESTGQPSDLSNLQIALDALKSAERAGIEVDKEVWERALVFLARVQNRSESNTITHEVADPRDPESGATVEVVSGDDGGAVYHPGSSKVGPPTQRADGKWELASYGSMTYALLKCLVMAGLPSDDPRVLAAVAWIQRNWTLDYNPGFENTEDPAKAGMQGYYYYLFTMARALAEFEAVLGKPLEVTDANGVKHDWRAELIAKLISLQREDGSWVNEVAERWMEGHAPLATGFALQALAWASGRFD